MSLRTRTLLILAVVFLGLLVGLGIASKFTVLRGFARLEEEQADENMRHVVGALNDDIVDLKGVARDWAGWDDAYAYIDGQDDAFFQSNLSGDTSFYNYRINVMLFIHSSGSIVFGTGFDLEDGQRTLVPEGLLRQVQPGSPLVSPEHTEGGMAGLLDLPEGPMLVASEPIVTSMRQGPIRGAVIFGRFLDTKEIQRLSRTTLLSLTSLPLQDPRTPSELRAVPSPSANRPYILVRPSGSASMEGYALLRGLYGQSGLVLKAEMPRTIYAQGRSTTLAFLASLAAIGVTSSMVVTLLLERMVLRRVCDLSAGVRDIGAQGDASARVSVLGRDEIAALGQSINQMLERLQRLQREQQRGSEELAQKAAALETANKELEAFSYSVSHDLRAPLRSIDGFSQALGEDYEGKLDTQGDDYLQRIRAATQRMSHMIDDILGLSRVTRQEVRRERVDLSEMARSVAAELQQTQPQRTVDFAIADGMAATGDKGLLQVALENLLGNAWKFTSQRPSALIEFGSTLQDGRQVFFVKDNGAGFNTAYAGKLFSPFQRLHSPGEFPGTGVGLATVQRIMHRHGGRVWAEAEEEKGATFYFTLPATGGEA
ncbi:MAG: HAMP domain-containing protein [Chloroflexi bacterium]|nr:HAMP domain-containing protein [Chloroflexota bacterium]